MSFADQMRARIPAALNLPDAFATTLDWLEAQGFDHTHDRPMDDPFRQRSLFLYPTSFRYEARASHVAFNFQPGPPLHAAPPEVTARICTIASIAGDGGTLSLWLDDAGTQQIVVFNHGNPYVLTHDPLTALQFLAIGYPEPAIVEDPTRTAAQQAAHDGGDPPILPEAYRAFLRDTFNVTPPDRASDLGITIPAEGAPDPLRDWLDATMPEPGALPIPGDTPDNPHIITRELRDAIGEEAVAVLHEVFQYVIEEE